MSYCLLNRSSWTQTPAVFFIAHPPDDGVDGDSPIPMVDAATVAGHLARTSSENAWAICCRFWLFFYVIQLMWGSLGVFGGRDERLI
jgi:hypothetical protein